MGLFDWLFPRKKESPTPYEETFKMLNGYTPRFTSFSGGIYEAELVRAAINAIAVHISKLHVETQGAAKPALQNKLRKGPNELQTWSQFLARAATMLFCNNTIFIVPVYDEYGEISGVFTPLPRTCEIVEQCFPQRFILCVSGLGAHACAPSSETPLGPWSALPLLSRQEQSRGISFGLGH